MRTLAPAILIVLYSALNANTPSRTNQISPGADTALGCAPLGSSYIRTTLYFGLNRPAGMVSEGQWKGFLRDQVTPRFPQGLTVWEANGQWQQSDGRIGRERAKVLLLVHDDTPAMHGKLLEVVEAYKKIFQQESVLWESARVCAMF
jgi:hypothetical protein